MSDNIKELVKEARGWHAGHSDDSRRMVWLMNKLSSALEELAGEVERLTSDVDALSDNLEKVVAERDRLKAALQDLHDDCVDYQRINNLGGYNNQVMVQARKALGDAS